MQKYIFIIFMCVTAFGNAMQSGGPDNRPSHEEVLKQQLINKICENIKKTDQIHKANEELEKENLFLRSKQKELRLRSSKVACRLTERQAKNIVLDIGQIFCLAAISNDSLQFCLSLCALIFLIR